MKFSSFLKDKFLFIFTQGLTIVFISVLLSVFKVGTSSIVFITFLLLLITFSSIFFEYVKKHRYYSNVYQNLNQMDKKQYLFQLMEEPDFADAEVMYDILKQVFKAMNDEISSHIISEQEYKEYIETWIHEIKLPISCIELICQNNKTTVDNTILDELKRIDNFVEQALFYARSTNVEKDYSVRELSLDSLVKSAIKKHSKQLIACKTELSFDQLDFTVYCDPKWLDFILGQVISNSMKYKNDTLKLSFSAKKEQEKIILSITDNGIGIIKKDLSRIFEKGFTGENGRAFAKSTGIGLYLCKRLCDKMYLGFDIVSEQDIGTTVKITFPKDSRVLLE